MARPKILVDARSMSNPSGVGALARGLISGLAAVQGDAQLHLAALEGQDFPGLECAEVEVHTLSPSRFLLSGVPKIARAIGARGLLIPRQTLPPATVRRCWRTSTIFHDIGFRVLPSEYPNTTLRTKVTSYHALMRADRVFTISDFTAREIASVAGRTVGVTPLQLGAVRRFEYAPGHCDPYALVVARQEPHKNLVRLVRAWKRRVRAPWTLVLVGARGADSNELETLVHDMGASAPVIAKGFATEGSLRELERHASLHINASLYEGLCIPIIDALASGAPVISSNRGHPGDLLRSQPTLLFDPLSLESIDVCLTRSLEDSDVREVSRRVGPQVAQLTDWKQVGLQIIQELVG